MNHKEVQLWQHQQKTLFLAERPEMVLCALRFLTCMSLHLQAKTKAFLLQLFDFFLKCFSHFLLFTQMNFRDNPETYFYTTFSAKLLSPKAGTLCVLLRSKEIRSFMTRCAGSEAAENMLFISFFSSANFKRTPR